MGGSGSPSTGTGSGMGGDAGRTAYDAFHQSGQARVSIESVGSDDMHALDELEQRALSAVKRARLT